MGCTFAFRTPPLLRRHLSNPHHAQSWMIGAGRQTLDNRCEEGLQPLANLAKAQPKPFADLPRRRELIPACGPPPGCVGYPVPGGCAWGALVWAGGGNHIVGCYYRWAHGSA
jgi:hypothetical protein